MEVGDVVVAFLRSSAADGPAQAMPPGPNIPSLPADTIWKLLGLA